MEMEQHLDDCLELWQSVLLTAIADFHNGSEEHGVNYQADARRWFESDEQDIGSLCWVCQQLGSASIIAQFVRR